MCPKERTSNMATPPTISVIMPVYNAARYLQQSLDSLSAQTLPPSQIDVICVDDGSTDSSPEILARHAERFPNFRIVSQENCGYGTALNVGIDLSESDFIGFLDPDDFMAPDMYEKLLPVAVETGADVVKTNYYDYSDAHGEQFQEFMAGREYGVPCNAAEDDTLMLLRHCVWSAVYRRDFLNDKHIRFTETPGSSYQDASFAFQVYGSARSIILLREGYVRYRIDNAASATKSTSKVFSVFDEMDAMETFVNASAERIPALSPVLAYKEFGLYEWNCRRLGPETPAARSTEPLMAMRLYRHQVNGHLDKRFFSDDEWQRVQRLLSVVSRDTDMAAHDAAIREEAAKASLTECRASHSYRLGHAILQPVRRIRNIVRRRNA